MTAQQLKNSILQLAVQGKLVPQDPNDEPASVLLERITKERERLIKEKKIKKPKSTSRIFRRDGHYYESVNGGEPACIDEQIPFDIPDTWEWVRLENLCSYIQRGKSPKYSPIKKYPVIAQKCNQWSGFSIDKAQFIAPETLSSYAEERVLQNYDLLWNSTGLGTLGRMAVYEAKKNPYELAVADSHVTVIRPLRNYVSSLYLYYYFANPSVQSVIEEQSDGSTKQKELSLSTVKEYLVPLPPTAEQLRINQAIIQVSPVLGEYNTAEKKLSELNETLPTSLKKSILQHAIQGKLVPQDPNDEPARVLLERIAKERAKLGKKVAKSMSRIERRDRGTFLISPDGTEMDITADLPFDIPYSWEWCLLDELGETNIGLTYKPADIKEKGVNVLRANNIQDGKICYDGLIRVNCEVPQRALIHKGDLLICARNGSKKLVGKTALIERDGDAFGAFMAKFSSPINDYLYYFLNSQFFREQLDEANTTTIYQVTQSMLRNTICPLPPLAEQRRICQRLETLLQALNK